MFTPFIALAGKKRPQGWVLALILTLGAGHALAQSPADPEGGPGLRRIEPVTASTAMAVTANPHATRAAVAILKAGGNAVDAAVGAQFVLNVVEPQSSGIGGGGFILIRLAKTGTVVTIDGREEAPASATPEMFLGADGKPVPFFPDRITGGKPVGVPGLPRALELALNRYGTRTLGQVLGPAIQLAEQGFPVSARLAEGLARHGERMSHFPATRAVFFDTGGQPLTEGAVLRQPDLARTFRLLASEGADVFYQGAIARDVMAAVNDAPVNPGRMTPEDLAGYRAVLRTPVRTHYRGYTLYGMGPPSSGGVTLFQMLALLETQPVPPGGALAPLAIHHFTQAARLAYADRARYLADADFVEVPVRGLLDPGYAARRAKTVDWNGPLTPVKAGDPLDRGMAGPGLGPVRESTTTTHLVVVDGQRNIVSTTNTIEQAFGSGMVVPGRGFLLNNELTDFAAAPMDKEGRLVANRADGTRRFRRTALGAAKTLGGKRPRSSMAPTLVLKDGQPWLAIGSPGGSRIIQYVGEVVVRMIDDHLALQTAIEMPHVTHLGKFTDLEPALQGTGLKEALEKLGHSVRFRPLTSGLHGVWFDPATGLLHGGVDPRREGLAAGY